MNSRKFAVFACALISAAAFATASRADGAVTVFGPGPATLCYDGADTGGDPGSYIFFCDEALNQALSVHDRAATFINRGVLRLALNEFNAAYEDFNAGLAVDASIGEGYIDRGVALIERKQFSEALADINKGLSLGAKRPALAYYDRAIANEALGDVTAAYHDYQQALVAEPGFTLASDELKRFKVVTKTTGS